MQETYITEALAKYTVSDAVIAQLSSDYKQLEIANIEDKTGYACVRAARIEIKKYRVQVEHKRKELNLDAIDFKKRVDDEAKRLTALLVNIESGLQQKEMAYEEAHAKIKRDIAESAQREIDAANAILAEAERLKIEAENLEIATALQKERDWLENERKEQEIVRQQLAEISRQQAEHAAALKAEADILERKRWVEEESKRIAKEQAEIARQAEFLRSEEKLKLENDAKLKAEQAPDKEKLQVFHDSFASMLTPNLTTKLSQKIYETFEIKFKELLVELSFSIKNL